MTKEITRDLSSVTQKFKTNSVKNQTLKNKPRRHIGDKETTLQDKNEQRSQVGMNNLVKILSTELRESLLKLKTE